jgi:hypothetical protein
MRTHPSLLCVLTCGCAAHFALPMTANEFVRYNTGPALVAYLGQPDASPSVCDVRSQGPHLTAFTPDVQEALMEGLVEGSIQPNLWSRCVKALLKGLPEDRGASLLDAQAQMYWKLLHGSQLEVDPAAGERVATLQRIYLDRSEGITGHPKVLGPIIDDLREAIEKNKLGPVATGFGQELLATVDVENGHWQGRDVSTGMMDDLAAAGNEMTLMRFSERLPSPELRKEASRRVVRIHISLSPFPEVRDAAAAVEERVLADGSNRIALGDHALVRAWFDPEKAPIRSVLVRESIWLRAATLLGYATDRPTLSVLPELSFRDALWAELASISRPVRLCGHKRSLDPTPCIDVADISLDNPFTYLDQACAFHFNDNVSISSIVPLAQQDDFILPVRIGGQPAISLHWGLVFERPENLAFGGSSVGRDGPAVGVRIERPHPSRFVFTASAPAGTFLAIVQASDLGQFRVESVGAQGPAGASGFAGSSGSSGAECQDGGSGGNGSPGGDGGRGGNGGDVRAQIVCGKNDCQDTSARLQGVVLSLGGPGGPGGAGGAGGSGGSGGPGRFPTFHTNADGATVMDDPGCSPGSSGMSGSSGPDGFPGPSGWPGRVTFEWAK